MNSTALSIKGVKVAVSALLAAAAFMALGLALGANNAKASTVGGDINPEFNYVGLYVGTTVAGDVDSVVLEPPADPIGINGKYTDTNGNFSVPKDTGLTFPPVVVDLDVVEIMGEIGLTKDGSGHYDEATGAMDLDLSLSLTLGVDDLEALSGEVGIPLGTGSLACQLSPLDVKFSTTNGWPHPGSSFTDKANLTDGSIAGAWRYKPAITATEGDQSVCNIIGGFLKPVGGIWLANSSTEVTDMPAATDPVPPVYTCEEDGLIGTPGNCEEPEPTVCPEGTTGTYPDCVPIEVPKLVANFSKVTVTPKKGKVKRGKKATIKVKVTNSGTAAGKATIMIKSSNKKVKAPKKLVVKVGAGKTVTKKFKITATRKAKGKAKITVKVGKKSAKSTLTIKK